MKNTIGFLLALVVIVVVVAFDAIPTNVLYLIAALLALPAVALAIVNRS